MQLQASPERDPIFSWSPLRNVVALDDAGRRVGPSFTVFKPVDVKHDLNLSSREYFQAFEGGRSPGRCRAAGRPYAWSPSAFSSH